MTLEPLTLLGRNVRIARKAGLMSQAQLAQKLGVSQATVSNIEAGLTRQPAEGLLQSIARICHVPLVALKCGRYDAKKRRFRVKENGGG